MVKAALYRRLTELLSSELGVRPQGVFISLLEVLPENFSSATARPSSPSGSRRTFNRRAAS
jgi:phenylpyruvate tautomerase PptA (4-oxalocrotonate tautomerase family)